MTRSVLALSLFLSSLLATAIPAGATSLQLVSTSPSGSDTIYTYAIAIDPFGSYQWNAGQAISLTNLFGVDGVSIFSLVNFTGAFTPTTVTVTAGSGGFSLVNGNPIPASFNLFTVSSTSSTEGTVSYVLGGAPAISGTISGPVTPPIVPEPSSLLLLSTGLLTLVQTARRKFRL